MAENKIYSCADCVFNKYDFVPGLTYCTNTRSANAGNGTNEFNIACNEFKAKGGKS